MRYGLLDFSISLTDLSIPEGCACVRIDKHVMAITAMV
jgi:hypothetical protein